MRGRMMEMPLLMRPLLIAVAEPGASPTKESILGDGR